MTIRAINAYNLIVDSNVTAPSTYAPNAGYIGAQICNTSGSPANDVIANVGNYLAPGRAAFSVTTTAGSTTITSTGGFITGATAGTASDGGLRIAHANLPAGTYITGVLSANTATVSTAATTSGAALATLSSAPGIFPVKSFPAFTSPAQLVNTGNYSLTIAAGTIGVADGARYIGTLAAGQCRVQYWLFTYPQCVNVSGASQAPPCNVAIWGDIKPDDDLRLDYDLWATSTSTTTGTATRSFTMRNEISAMANKIWPNTTSKVPDDYLSAIQSVIGWGTLGPDGLPLSPTTPVYPGQRLITTQGIWYDLGNVGHGFDNDGDLIPDQNAWMQPVGDAATFNASCFRLVNVYGIVIVKLKTGGELLIPFQNQLYHERLPDNTGVVGLVYYQFIATDGTCTAVMSPYQEAASGFDNEKFNGDYGLTMGLFSQTFGSALNFQKTDGLTSTTNGATLTYNITASNNTGTAPNYLDGVPLGAPEYGAPLVFRESIPDGTTFVAGTADDSPTTNLIEPTGSGRYEQDYRDTGGNTDTCTIDYQISASRYIIEYSTDDGQTWSLTEPAAASVTDIRWSLLTTLLLDGGHDGTACIATNGVFDNGTLETSLPSGTILSGSPRAISLTFQVTVNAASASNAPGPVLCNTARVGVGPASTGTTATDCDLVSGPNQLSGTVFEDDGEGTGSIYGNGIQNNAPTGEVGIGAGVRVTLYYDVNGDGDYDAGTDLEYDPDSNPLTFTTTNSSGFFQFTGLPDGPYLVVARKYDGADDDNAATEFAAGRNALANADDTVGWGNTTRDPNLPATTNNAVIGMAETFGDVQLAVNLDKNHTTGALMQVTDVNFAFAPPFRLTKVVQNNPDLYTTGTTPPPNDVADTVIDEGEPFTYTITLENRLPSTGRQGPTGCEYVAWGTTGATDTVANKAFTAPENAYDSTSPNGSYASALVTGGGNRWMWVTNFALQLQAGNITKVEGLFFAYYGSSLTDDYMYFQNGLGAPPATGGSAPAAGSPYRLETSMIDSYTSIPPDFDPNSAISWDMTALRPGGGAWGWTDFASLYLYLNPSKASAADQKTFFLDAVGVKVTTDAPCVATPNTTLSPVPLQDRYDTGRLAFVSSSVTPTSIDTATGTIQWADVGEIPPGTSRVVTVTMRPLDVDGLNMGSCAAFTPPGTVPGAPPWNNNCNYVQSAYSTLGVKYADGRAANDDYDKIAVSIQGKAEIRGTVYHDVGAAGFPIDTTNPAPPNVDVGLPVVTVTLWGCVRANGVTLETTSSNKSCAAETAGNFWKSMGTTTTTSTGTYEFIGLDTGHYIVEVGDTDGIVGTLNTAPYGGTQSTEGNDSQAYTGGATGGPATGHVCPACNNTWGTSTADLNTMNQLSQANEETITGVDFGYTGLLASLYGNVWNNLNADADKDAGEPNLPDFTVQAYLDSNADNIPDPGELQSSTTTDSSGNYSFINLLPGNYVIVVTPPALRNQAWQETAEVSPTGTGTSTLDDIILEVLSSAEISGSHDFGYTLGDVSSIGDTLFLDSDGDGVKDSNEPGIADVTVRLYLDVDRDGMIDVGTDTEVATDDTDLSGLYLFEDLAEGSYIVEIDTDDPDFPPTVEPTADPDVISGRIGDRVYYDVDRNGASSRTFATGGTTSGSPTVTSSVAAFQATDVGSSISGAGIPAGARIIGFTSTTSVTISANATATASGVSLTVHDQGIPNVFVVLYEDSNASGGLNSGDNQVAAMTTDMDGYYLFTGLHAGNYIVDVSDSSSETSGYTLPNAGLAIVGTDPRNTLVTLATNTSSVLTADAGYAASSSFAVGNRVWSDADGDGFQDFGETGISGVTVRVFTSGLSAGSCTGTLLATRTTDAGGYWGVAGLSAATYCIDILSTTQNILDAPRNFRVTNGAEARAVTITTFDRWDQDFGYRYDTDTVVLNDRDIGDPTGVITGRVYFDRDDDLAYDSGEEIVGAAVSLIDDSGYVVATTTSASDGSYAFGGSATCTVSTSPACSGVFIGLYSVRATAATTVNGTTVVGTRFSTIFVSNATAFPNLNVIFDEDTETVDDSQSSVAVDGVHADLMQDFGYRPVLGSIGDTVWLDVNGNATQDVGEAGISGVTVQLWTCTWTDDGDGTLENGEQGCNFTSGTPTLTTVTTADDPLTGGDESGKYLFSSLGAPPANNYYVVRVVTATGPLATAVQTGDPDNDGSACPGTFGCDSLQGIKSVGTAGWVPGTNYLGADFGYQFSTPVSGYATIGDFVWFDIDGDGLQDVGEPGIDNVRVWVDSNNDGVIDWTDSNSNGRWESGEGERWAITDGTGFYLFSNVANGTYDNIKVFTADLPDPAMTITYDRQGAVDNDVDGVLVSGGAVTSIGGVGCTSCNLTVDFGYRIPGTLTLSGTVCVDEAGQNGYCNTTNAYSGVSATESAIPGMQVYLFRWTDTDADNVAWDGSGNLDAGDTFLLLNTTTTAANGDYTFSNVPASTKVLVAVSTPTSLGMRLTTTATTDPAEQPATTLLNTLQLYEGTSTFLGATVTTLARSSMSLGAAGDIVDVDFAYDSSPVGLAWDFGDLPESTPLFGGTTSYLATILGSGGARALTGGPTLGSAPSSEDDGKADDDAGTLAGGDDNEAGVTLVSGQFVEGYQGGTVQVTVSGLTSGQTAYVAGWIDFNQDGDFVDVADSENYERVVFAPVSANGTTTYTFNVPAGVAARPVKSFFVRFRIYSSLPLLVAPIGMGLDATFAPTTGEIEDYLWTASATRALVSRFVARDLAGGVTLEWRTAAEDGTVGFLLERWDDAQHTFVSVNEKPLLSLLGVRQGGTYRYVDPSARPGQDHVYRLVEIESSGRRNNYGPYRVNTTSTLMEAAASDDAFEADARVPGYRHRANASRDAKRAVSRRTFQPASVVASAAKIGVGQTGIYFVSDADLSTWAGLDPSRLGPTGATFALEVGGQVVPHAKAPGGFLFYGRELDSPWSAYNVYRFGEGEGLAMPMLTLPPPAPASGNETFTRTVHAELDWYPLFGLFDDPRGDLWLWDYWYSGDPAKSFPFRADGAVPGRAMLSIRLKGATATDTTPDHHVAIRINGQPVGDVTFDGNETKEATIAFDGSLLVDGDNSLEIVGLEDTGAPYSLVFVDAFDVSYRSRYRAVGNRLAFGAGGNAAILVSGFTRKDTMLFDVTDPSRPVQVMASRTIAGDGSYALHLSPSTPNASYYAATPDALLAPVALVPDTPSDLRNAANRGEYLIVTTADLKPAAQTLADHRGDLQSQVVDIQDVYDEFGFGVSSPLAIKAFLTHAFATWAVKPHYVLFAGDGSWDYRDLFAAGDNLVPPMLVKTPHGIWASDSWYGDVSEKLLGQELAIGRLPAVNDSELRQMIQKIQARESALDSRWMGSLLLTADDRDHGGDFPTASDLIGSVAPLSQTRLYIGTLGAPAVRDGLIAGINEGVGFVNYIGHGGVDLLADESILRNADMYQLTNAGRPTVLTALTCTAGDFSSPGYPGLGEALVRDEDGGAAAVWGPTAVGQNDLAYQLGYTFYGSLFATQGRLGDVIVTTTGVYATALQPPYMLPIYNLLGDPAMRVR